MGKLLEYWPHLELRQETKGNESGLNGEVTKIDQW